MVLMQSAAASNNTFSISDIHCLIIGIIGYFTVPSVANYIIHAGGSNALLQKVTNIMSLSTRNAVTGSVSMTRDALGGAYTQVRNSMADSHSSAGYFKDKIAGKNDV